mgnify:CR=1 FL=1
MRKKKNRTVLENDTSAMCVICEQDVEVNDLEDGTCAVACGCTSVEVSSKELFSEAIDALLETAYYTMEERLARAMRILEGVEDRP